MTRKRILFVGDGPDCPSGFGLATRRVCEALDYRLSGDHEVTVLGINYLGDPGTVPYNVYAAVVTGDMFGVNRILWMCDTVKPDLIILQNDGWNMQAYLRQLRRKDANGKFLYPDKATIPVVAIVAVDGKNFRSEWLDGISHSVFWTQFALDEARLGGYSGPASVIPLGVDLETYYPTDRAVARFNRFGNPNLEKFFIVGNVNRNQSRKRWDLTVRYFGEWVRQHKPEDVALYLHTAPTGDGVLDVKQLAKYYGVQDRLCLMEPEMFYGITLEGMRDTYNCFDVQISTTQGEGFGLTTFEGMACGVPQIVPDWSALGELCKDACAMVPCTSTAVGPPYVNVIGGVPDEDVFINALDRMYRSPSMRDEYRQRGLALVRNPRYDWTNIGRQYAQLVASELQPLTEEVWQDLGRPEATV